MFHHLSGALGSYAGGLVFDRSRSYLGIFTARGVLVAASSAFTLLARAPRGRRAGPGERALCPLWVLW